MGNIVVKKARKAKYFNSHAKGYVFSTNFMELFVNNFDKEQCYIALSDFRKLEKQYYKLFKKYKELKNGK